MKYAWIDKFKTVWPVTLMCLVLEVSISGFFEHRQRGIHTRPQGPERRRPSNEAVLAHIRSIHAEFKGENGWPRVWKELPASDITYLATDEGWLYLAAVIDLFSRQVVGWSMQPHMQPRLVTDALRMAWFRRHQEPGLIFHSDRGSQYCSHAFQDALRGYGMRSSMSRKGNCWNNAPMESLRGSLKVGRLYGKRFATHGDAMDEVIDWLTFYNRKRSMNHALDPTMRA